MHVDGPLHDHGVVAERGVDELAAEEDAAGLAGHADVGLSLMGPYAAKVERLETPGGGRLARMLCLMLLGDFASVYLAYLNDVDPTPVKKIDTLKKQLAGQAG